MKLIHPWIITTYLANLSLSCEISNFRELIDFESIKVETNKILNDHELLSHPGNHDGGWNGISLIAYGGDPNNTAVKDQKPTETFLLEKCPSIKKLLYSLPGKKHRVRFLEVKPGKKVFWHFDNGETIDNFDYSKNARFHMPIYTNKNVLFKISHEKLEWEEGKIYYGDFSFPHTIHNKSNENRVHLIIDLQINDELISNFPKKFLDLRKKRLFFKKFCQRSLNLFKKLNIVEKD